MPDPGHFFLIPITEKGIRMKTLDVSNMRFVNSEL